ncbi:MAG: ABC transporter ATP-binding protein [Chloroflexota bacterium]
MQIEQPIIQVSGLSRLYKEVRAVSDLNFVVQPGDLFGLVGPDGAGKTTTLRLLAGLLSISEGEASVAGMDLKSESEGVKSRIGYMAQEFSLYAELSVVENLRFFADIYDVPVGEMDQRMERLLGFANLLGFKDRRADKLSGGMQKKLALACCLIHEPKILLLDEPTTGVDPISRREFWNILNQLHLAGTTILVSTPYMDEADRCSKIGLMYQGEMIMHASPREIRQQIDGEIVILLTDNWKKAREIVSNFPGVQEVQTYGEALHIIVDDADKRIKQFERNLKKANITHQGLRSAPARMEEAFISLMHKMEERDVV